MRKLNHKQHKIFTRIDPADLSLPSYDGMHQLNPAAMGVGEATRTEEEGASAELGSVPAGPRGEPTPPWSIAAARRGGR